MTQDEYARKLDELDHLLNDPDVPLDPTRVWSLLADLAARGSGPAVASAGAADATFPARGTAD